MMKFMIAIVSLLILVVVGGLGYFIWSKENYKIKSDSTFTYSEQSWSVNKKPLDATPSNLKFRGFDNGQKKYKAPSTFEDRTKSFK